MSGVARPQVSSLLGQGELSDNKTHLCRSLGLHKTLTVSLLTSVARLHYFRCSIFPFCPLMLIYYLPNIQIEIPYSGITRCRARLLIQLLRLGSAKFCESSSRNEALTKDNVHRNG